MTQSSLVSVAFSPLLNCNFLSHNEHCFGTHSVYLIWVTNLIHLHLVNYAVFIFLLLLALLLLCGTQSSAFSFCSSSSWKHKNWHQRTSICQVSGCGWRKDEAKTLAGVHVWISFNALRLLVKWHGGQRSQTRISATADRLSNALCQSKSCQLLHNCRNKLSHKSTTNWSNGVRALQSMDVQ